MKLTDFLNRFTFLLFTIACLLVSFNISNFLLSILCCFMSGTLIGHAIFNFKKNHKMKKILDNIVIFLLCLIPGPIIMRFIRNDKKDNWLI